jgi:hypothetical protein
MGNYRPNPGQKLFRVVDGKKYLRIPVKTKVITPEDNIGKIVLKALEKNLRPGDIIGISEKATAISQGRSYHLDEVNPGILANFLVGYVTKSKRGVGLSSPQTFQLAIDECGRLRIIFAAIIGGIGKILGIKGLFYYIAGNKARLIDGAAEYVIPPYNKHVSKGPANPDQVSQSISDKLVNHNQVAIIDINDYGGQVVGASRKIKSRKIKRKIVRILKDNPLGQSDECTPIVIIREVGKND